jgi:ATP-dependent RNA helicase RhlE
MRFTELNLVPPLLSAIAAEGYEEATPVQQQAIPLILAGRDLLACAQTGTGKTAAFALPLLQRLSSAGRPYTTTGQPRVLVLTPTRELAAQIGKSFAGYGRNLQIHGTVIFGGVNISNQMAALRRVQDVVVATPGRLLDLMRQGRVSFDSLEALVLDEADTMLDMGFLPDVTRIIAACPKQRQTLLFSATMPGQIRELSRKILNNPALIQIATDSAPADGIAQSVYFVAKNQKRALLEHLLNDKAVKRALVFTRTKRGANKVAEQLQQARIDADAIHGNKSQSARERALGAFRNGEMRVLVATDVAARGIDVDGISHVINYDLPNVPESYVHRIGRTARAGAEGIAWAFCDAEESPLLSDIQKLIQQRIPVNEAHPFHVARSDIKLPAKTQGGARPLGNGRPGSGARPPGNGRPSSGANRNASSQGRFGKPAYGRA